jgi:hypothetical protein
MPAALQAQLGYPPELFRLAMLQLPRANVANDSAAWTPRPRDPFQVVQHGVWTAVGFEAGTPARFVGLLVGTVGPGGPSLRLWRPGPRAQLPGELVGSSETSPGDLRIWLAGDAVVTLQAQFIQLAAAAPRGIAEVYATLGEHSGHGPTRAAALRALVTGESRTPTDTSLAARWERARRLAVRADAALAAGDLEGFGRLYRELVGLLAPAPRPR